MRRRTEGGSTVQIDLPQYDIGVLVGRFQVHELHDAHRDLIQTVCDSHEKVIIFLGLSPLPNSASNPLDFESRKQMILAEFPDVNVLYIADHPSDDEWSKKLDRQITDLSLPGQSVVLYGGRDSFISHYTGQHPTRELLQATFRSGTEVRRSIARSRARASAEFRAGAIWASQSRYPTAYTTVDVAVFNENGQKLLLGRKDNEKLFRFIGGFSDPASGSFEQDARREVMEEAGVEIGDVKYIGSMRVDDWRYRAEPDCIKTMLFRSKYLHGRPAPNDDIAEVRWFDLVALSDTRTIVPEHRPLMEMLFDNLSKEA
jgi:bifunctional NMN adenylyltransferase/nudix hydrolase